MKLDYFERASLLKLQHSLIFTFKVILQISLSLIRLTQKASRETLAQYCGQE